MMYVIDASRTADANTMRRIRVTSFALEESPGKMVMIAIAVVSGGLR